MAFSMFHGVQRVVIEHHEEVIFNFINGDKYPKLNAIKENLYDDPVFNCSECNEIVHELINLRVILLEDKSSKYLCTLIDHLLPFFSKAYQESVSVQSVSD